MNSLLIKTPRRLLSMCSNPAFFISFQWLVYMFVFFGDHRWLDADSYPRLNGAWVSHLTIFTRLCSLTVAVLLFFHLCFLSTHSSSLDIRVFRSVFFLISLSVIIAVIICLSWAYCIHINSPTWRYVHDTIQYGYYSTWAEIHPPAPPPVNQNMILRYPYSSHSSLIRTKRRKLTYKCIVIM